MNGFGFRRSAFVLLLLITAVPSSQAQYFLTNCTGLALSNAVANYSHIVITCDGVITAPSQLVITHDLIIESTSPNASLRGQNGNRLFIVNSSVNLMLLNVTFADSFSTNVGAVFFNRGGNIVVRDCMFRNNVARGADAVFSVSAPARGNSGGVIFQFDVGTFTAIHCVFDQNSATGGNGLNGGSAPSSWGGTGQGGVAYISRGAALFTNCFFSRNTAAGGSGRDVNGGAFGGALLWDAGTTGIVIGCTFSNNTAYALNPVIAQGGRVEAGAIWTTGRVLVADCSFVSNRCVAGYSGAAYGGAIHDEFELQIERCDFIGNEAVGGEAGNNAASFAIPGGPAVGGAIMSEGSFSATDCRFEWNKALGGNGGRATDNSPTPASGAGGGACGTLAPARGVYMTNCSFVGHLVSGGNGGSNFAQGAAGGTAGGGTIYSLATNNVFVNCTVGWTTNIAGLGGAPNGANGWARGGAFYFSDSTALISHCSFASNALVAGSSPVIGFSYATDVLNQTGRVSLFATLLGNGFGSTNVSGTFIDLGFNLCGDNSLAIGGGTSASNVNLLIGPPALNGGRVQTMALLPGSPALNAIPYGTAGVALTDARGVARPQGNASDIGAFEVATALNPPLLQISQRSNQIMTTIFGDAGQSYRLLAASFVPTTNWTAIANVIAVSNGPVFVTTSNSALQQFFRTISP
jgi:hypothetical protein